MCDQCLKRLAEVRDFDGFEHKDTLDATVGTAIQVLGPDVVIDVIPHLNTDKYAVWVSLNKLIQACLQQKVLFMFFRELISNHKYLFCNCQY